MTEHQRHRGLAVALVALVTIVAFETMSVATIMPTIRDELGGTSLYGWAFAGLALGQIVGIVFAGRWADRVNLVWPLVAVLVAYAVGLAVTAAAPTMGVVVAGRFLQGIGAGGTPTITYTCVGRGFEPDERGRMFAWMSTAWIVPSLVGPLAAATVAEHVGWRWVFAGLIPVVLVAGCCAFRPIAAVGAVVAAGTGGEEGANAERGVVRAAIVLTVGAAIALGGFRLHQPVAAVLVSVVGVAAAVPAFRRLTPAGTLTARPGMPAAIAVRGLMTFAFFGADAFVTLALQSVRHTSATFGGVALTFGAFTWTAGAWIQARMVVTVGPRRLVRQGLGFIATGVGLMALTTSTQVPVALGVVAWSVAGFGMGLGYSPLAQAVLMAASPREQARATAALQLSDTFGVVIGTGLGGIAVALADRWGHPIAAGLSVVWGASIAVAVLGLLAAAGIARSVERDAQDSGVTAERSQ